MTQLKLGRGVDVPYKPMMIGAAAKTISEVFYGGHDSQPIARQMRHLTDMGAVMPRAKSGFGRTAGVLLEETDVCKLRLLSVLVANGLTPDLLRAAGSTMNNVIFHKQANTVTLVGWPRLLAGIRDDEDWLFVMHIQQAAGHLGGFQLVAESEVSKLLPPSVGASLNVQTIILPATRLLRPLLTREN